MHHISAQCFQNIDLNSVFWIDITNDVPDIHSLMFCYRCKRVIDKSVLAENKTCIQNLNHSAQVGGP